MICFPNAKINLGLYVTHRRDDGYHDLETVFYPVQLCDVLEIVPAQTTSLQVTGIVVEGDPHQNLVWKAYQLMRKKFGEKIPEVAIYLHKNIPTGAGLGGGSSDGAHMLMLLNQFAHLGCTNEELAAWALELGSDCPFFIHNTACFASGRGEQLEPISLDLSAYQIKVEFPEIHISTAESFQNLVPRKAPLDLHTLPQIPIKDWKNLVSNDFETYALMRYPKIADLKAKMYQEGALYAAMSGSGSAVFGIFSQ